MINPAGQQQRQMNFPAGTPPSNQGPFRNAIQPGMQAAGMQQPGNQQQAMNSLSGQNEHQLRQLLMTQQPNRTYPNQFQ